MNVKKRVLLFIIIGLIIASLGVGSYFFFFKSQNEDVNVAEKAKYGLIQEYRVENVDNLEAYKSFYIIAKDKNIKIYDYDNNLIYSFENNNGYEILENECILIYSDNENILVDKNGKELFKTKKLYYIHDTQDYFLVDRKLYDKNLKEIYTFSHDVEAKEEGLLGVQFNFSIFNDYIVDYKEQVLINYKTNEKIFTEFDRCTLANNFIVLEKENKYYLFDVKKVSLLGPYDLVNGNDDYYKLRKDDEIIYFDNYSGKLYDKNNKKMGEYTVDFDTCEKGLILKNSDGTKKIDECQDSFLVVGNNIIAIKDGSYNLYLNGSKTPLKYDHIDYDDNYIFANNFGDSPNRHIYNYNGEKQKLEKDVGKSGRYYTTYYLNNIFLLDDNLNEVIKGEDISCNNYGWCVVRNGTKTTLYDNNKVVYSEDYIDIEINDLYIVIKSLWNKEILVYQFGTDNFIDYKTIGKENDKLYEDINIDEMIEKYELNNIKDIIEKDQTLFKKYAFLVEKNHNLNGYQKYVMDMYKVLFDNKEFLEENVFFEVLNRLKFGFKEYDDVASGTYKDGNITLINSYKKDETVIYHELMHFIDLSLNKNKKIYKCEEKYYLEMDKAITDDCENVVPLTDTFIIEAGAELFTAKYMTNRFTTYENSVILLELLEYIFGSDFIKELYFDQTGNYKLLKMFLDSGYTYEESEDIMHLLYIITSLYEESDEKDLIKAVDFIIDLYKAYKKEDWLKDEKFRFILESLIIHRDYSSSKYYNELKVGVRTSDEYNDFINSINRNLGDSYTIRVLPLHYLNIFGKDYLSFDAYYYPNGVGYKGAIEVNLLAEYDFSKHKIISYKEIL